MKWFIAMVFVVLLFVASCSNGTDSQEVSFTAQELNELPEDDPAKVLYLEENDLVGQAIKYKDLTSKQKRAFWGCWKNECQVKLKEAQETKNYNEYRTCSLGCFSSVQEETADFCEDSDGLDFIEKGIVTTNDYFSGSQYDCKKVGDKYECSDTCYTFSNGKEYLIEMQCQDGKASYVQKNCGEFGEGFVCEEGVCLEEITECPEFSEVTIPNEQIVELTFDECSYLKDSNGIKYYFYKNQINEYLEPIIYIANDEDNLIGVLNLLPVPSEKLIDYPSTVNKISINKWDGSEIFVTIDNTCDQNSDFLAEGKFSWCGIKNNQLNSNEITVLDTDHFKFLVENDLYPDPVLRNEFIQTMSSLYENSYDFLFQELGAKPPLDKVYVFAYLYQSGGGHAFHYTISYASSEPNELWFQNWNTGNTHEQVHTFFWETPVEKSWFEEGLAEYMDHLESGNKYIKCSGDGWQEGYYENEIFTETSPFVSYSDFTVQPDNSVDFYDPLKRASYYRSAECFWHYISENYGKEGVKSIAQKWQGTRLIFPTENKWLIKDIVNPALGVDLTELIMERYNYVEGEST